MININKLFGCLLICLLLTSCESPRKQQHNEPEVIKVSRNIQVPNYTVQEGDTVGSIAHQHNITRSDLIELNNLTPPYELYAGQKLIVKSKNEENSSVQEDFNNINESDSNSNELNSNNYKFKLIQKGGLLTKEDINTLTINNDSDNYNTTENDNILIEDNSQENKPSEYVWPVNKNTTKILKHFKDTKEYTIIKSTGGSPVKAIADGVVKFSGTPQNEGTLGYGKMVIVKHENPSRVTLYAKLGNTNVTQGQRVKKGQKIGTVAREGKLYFSLMNDKKKNKRTYIDPESIMN